MPGRCLYRPSHACCDTPLKGAMKVSTLALKHRKEGADRLPLQSNACTIDTLAHFVWIPSNYFIDPDCAFEPCAYMKCVCGSPEWNIGLKTKCMLWSPDSCFGGIIRPCSVKARWTSLCFVVNSFKKVPRTFFRPVTYVMRKWDASNAKTTSCFVCYWPERTVYSTGFCWEKEISSWKYRKDPLPFWCSPKLGALVAHSQLIPNVIGDSVPPITVTDVA